MTSTARLGCAAATLGSLSLGLTAPALADTDSFGQKVYMCAQMMLPYDLDPGGSITMTMPVGTVMYFRTFGGMVTYMQSNPMCS
jgi:hypothetical protein